LVDLDALCWNFRQIKQRVGPGVKVLSMVKANGYGHGAPVVAKSLEKQGGDAFGVATLEEAVELRRAGIVAPILVVAGAYVEQLDHYVAHKLSAVAHEIETVKVLDAAARERGVTLDVHLKIDTGMGRLGFVPSEMQSWLPALKQLKAVTLTGVFSHFSQAESVAGEYTQQQLETFRRALQQLKSSGISPPLVHLANSAATITLPAAHFDMVRPGLILYGIYPSPAMRDQISLKPVLSWHTRVLQLKKVPKGTSISYGQTFITKRKSLIATLPVGYADGYPRLLSNRGAVLIKGRRAPVAGRVCMDLTMVDVTDIAGVRHGDEVVLLGGQDGAEITADEMAGWSSTISYEILTSIGVRVPRLHYSSKEDH
jgi:alanine racemase